MGQNPFHLAAPDEGEPAKDRHQVFGQEFAFLIAVGIEDVKWKRMGIICRVHVDNVINTMSRNARQNMALDEVAVGIKDTQSSATLNILHDQIQKERCFPSSSVTNNTHMPRALFVGERNLLPDPAMLILPQGHAFLMDDARGRWV